MWTRLAERRCWLLSKALETCSSLDEALRLAREAEAFLALSDDAELPALPDTALQPSTAEVANTEIIPVPDPEAQSTVVVAAAPVEPIPEPGSGGPEYSVSAASGVAVSALSVFAVPEDITRYLCRQGIRVEAAASGQYKVEGRLEPLSLLQTRANALRASQNLPPFELMPIPAIRPKRAGLRLGAPGHPSGKEPRFSSNKSCGRSTDLSAAVPTQLGGHGS